MTNNTPDYEDNLYFDSQNTKSEQLTEQWKKGELPEAWYYVKNIHNKEILDRYFKETDNFEYLEDWEVDEVLAPVPSYEEWEALNKGYDSAVDANLKQATWMVGMEKENKRLKHDVGNLGYKIKNQRHEIDNRLKEIEKLKELLKECRPALLKFVAYTDREILLMNKINEVLK